MEERVRFASVNVLSREICEMVREFSEEGRERMNPFSDPEGRKGI